MLSDAARLRYASINLFFNATPFLPTINRIFDGVGAIRTRLQRHPFLANNQPVVDGYLMESGVV
jgi:hypothetical protein